MRTMWLLTVASLRQSLAAISAFDRPWATSRTTPSSPFSALGNQNLGLYGNSPLVGQFSLREVTFPAWTLTAFAIAALAGMLIRRVVPAIAAALAVYAGLAIAAAGLLRER